MLCGACLDIISVMIFAVLIVLGLCFGSFVNAFVWRLHEQQRLADGGQPLANQPVASRHQLTASDLSVMKGRSMCPQCHHELAAKDLIPVLSWLWLKGKCHYCGKPISAQYPAVEVATALLFIVSYVSWPVPVQGTQAVVFALWLVLLIGFMALLVYDLRWRLLPNRVVFSLTGVAAAMQIVALASDWRGWGSLLAVVLGAVIGGGLFYLLFQVSSGRWIGGGDVKLGLLLGITVGSGEKSFLFIFIAALLGSLVSIPLLAAKRLKRTSAIPFGPFLIIGAIAAMLYGPDIIHWYNHTFLLMD